MFPLLPIIRDVSLLAAVQASIPDQVPFLSVYDNATTPILAVPSARRAALYASVGSKLFPGFPFAKLCFVRNPLVEREFKTQIIFSVSESLTIILQNKTEKEVWDPLVA